MSQRFEIKVRPADIAIAAIIKAVQTELHERLAKLTSALTHSFSEMTWTIEA